LVRQEQERVEHEESSLKQQIQQAMGSATFALFANGKVSWKKTKDSTTTDLKKLAAENPELVARYAISKLGSRRFVIEVGS
jgi:predicted phage-related endonuclease